MPLLVIDYTQRIEYFRCAQAKLHRERDGTPKWLDRVRFVRGALESARELDEPPEPVEDISAAPNSFSTNSTSSTFQDGGDPATSLLGLDSNQTG